MGTPEPTAALTLRRGFRFGLLLQVAVGPVCLFVFNAAVSAGFPAAEVGVLAVVVVDAAYVGLASVGIASVLGRQGARRVLRLFGAAVLLLFGADILLRLFGAPLLPDIALGTGRAGRTEFFLAGLLLTASNPLTIVFWSGVFSGKAAEEGMDRRRLLLFGAGAVLATPAFLSLVAAAGSVTRDFLPTAVLAALNAAVAVALVVFALRMLLVPYAAPSGPVTPGPSKRP